MILERKPNDVGGLPAGEINREDHIKPLYEKRIDAMMMLLTSPAVGAFTVDAMRRAIEDNAESDYRKLGYYDLWVRAMRDLLIERGVLTREEISAKTQEIQSRGAQVSS